MPPRPTDDEDPRSEAEQARADLKANAELGTAPTMIPLTRQPSVTPKTFGVTNAKAQVLSGIDQGVEAGGPVPEGRDAGRSGSIVEAEQTATGRDSTAPARTASEDVLSRSKE